MPRVELADTISQRHLGARLGRATREEHELADLAMDVRDVIASLPPELCELAERLKTDSLSQIARGTGHLPRVADGIRTRNPFRGTTSPVWFPSGRAEARIRPRNAQLGKLAL